MWLFIKLQPPNDIIVDQCNCDEKMNFKKKVVSAKLDVIGWPVWIGLWCWPSHFKWFKLQQKLKRNLKSDPSYHLLKKALKKCANDSLRDIFIQWIYRHTLATQRKRFAITFWKGKNSSKGWNFNKKWKKTPKGTHHSIFWRRWWKSVVR